MSDINKTGSGESTELTPEQKKTFCDSIKTLVAAGVLTLSACDGPKENTLVIQTISDGYKNNFVEIKVNPELGEQYQKLLEQPGNDTIAFVHRHCKNYNNEPQNDVYIRPNNIPFPKDRAQYNTYTLKGVLKKVIDPNEDKENNPSEGQSNTPTTKESKKVIDPNEDKENSPSEVQSNAPSERPSVEKE